MPHANRTLRLLTLVVAACLTALSVPPASNAAPQALTAPTALSAATGYSSLPTACWGNLARIDPGSTLYAGGVRSGQGVWSYPFENLGMGVAPIAWTDSGTARGTESQEYLAAGQDGRLWSVVVFNGYLDNSAPAPGAGSGWGTVRSMTYADRSTLVYGLRGTALVRYGFEHDATGTYVKSSRVMASTGWGGARKIASGGTATVNGRLVDTLYVITTAGALNLYTIDQATNTMRGYPLRTTGWQYVTQLNAERCTPTGGVTLVGILNGAAYLYRDPVSDATGDIISYGLITKGMSGTLYS